MVVRINTMDKGGQDVGKKMTGRNLCCEGDSSEGNATAWRQDLVQDLCNYSFLRSVFSPSLHVAHPRMVSLSIPVKLGY